MNALTRFVRLPENRSAYRAVVRLLKSVERGIEYPPLFLHGPPGSGKSHLAAGLVQGAVHDSGRIVQFLAAAELGQGLLQPPAERKAVRRDAIECDLLVLEDVQHLPPAAANDLGQILDRRLARQRYTMVTSARAPSDLTHPAKLVSRFVAGLVVAVRPLAEESRCELAISLCRDRQLRVTDEVIDWLARDPGGARPILGTILQLEQLAKVHRPPLGLKVVQAELPAAAEDTPPMARIVEVVATHAHVSAKAIRGASRLKALVQARHLAMYLGRQKGLTLMDIAHHLGGRDHTTVMHGVEKVGEAVSRDPQLAQAVRDLLAQLS